MDQEKTFVWDPLVRLFHWSLVIGIAIAWLTSEDASELHELAGYSALGLIGFRVLWGVFGPKNARFVNFVRSTDHTILYTKDLLKRTEKRYLGHNPLGALMVIAILLVTAATGITGWLGTESDSSSVTAAAISSSNEQDKKPSSSKSDEEKLMKEIHEVLANFLFFLIFVHILGVIYTSRRHKENLATAMITGKKHKPGPDDII